jgi:hypothetical protein
MEKTSGYDVTEYSQFLYLLKFHMKNHLIGSSRSLISRDSSKSAG